MQIIRKVGERALVAIDGSSRLRWIPSSSVEIEAQTPLDEAESVVDAEFEPEGEGRFDPPGMDSKSCPRCGCSGSVARLFGYRNMLRAGGVRKPVPQAQCKSCRSKKPVKALASAEPVVEVVSDDLSALLGLLEEMT